MEVVAIAAVIIALTFIVLVAFLVPTLIEIRKTAAAARTYLVDIDAQVKPILRDVSQLTANVRDFTEGVVAHTAEVKLLMTALGDVGRNVSRINTVVGEVAGLVSKSTLWLTGLKAASRFVMDRIAHKRR